MKFNDWLEDESKIILFDGGMGSEIIKRGLEPGKTPDILNIEQPQIITDIHKAYYNAGSDMCQTNTFGASLLNLQNHKIQDRIKEINEAALANIKSVCPTGRLIIGDIGPSGTFKPPIGKTTFDEWISGFQAQVKLLEHGVDLWHVETISEIDEMVAAIQAIKSISHKPIISSITYKLTKRGYFTVMGNSVEQCIKIQENEGVDVIGANCTLGSLEMIDLTKELKKYTEKPISVKPNAGKPRIEPSGKTLYDQPPEEFANDIQQMIEFGAKIVGGCCGTSPETIKLIRNIIDSR